MAVGGPPPPLLEIPPEVLDLFAQYERRIRYLETLRQEIETREYPDHRADIEALQDRMDTAQADVVALEARVWDWSDIDPLTIPSTFTPAEHGNEAHTPDFISSIAWGDVTGKPSTFTPSDHGNEAHTPDFISSIAWADVTGKPSSFAPEDHGNVAHSSTFISSIAWADVTGKPSTYTPEDHPDTAHSADYAEDGHSHTYASTTHKHTFDDLLDLGSTDIETGGPSS